MIKNKNMKTVIIKQQAKSATPVVNPVTCIAIKPGKHGGIALNQFGRLDCWPMPATDGDLISLVREILYTHVEGCGRMEGIICVMEQPHDVTAHKSFTPAQVECLTSFEFIKAVFQTLGVKIALVPAPQWRKAFGLADAPAAKSRSAWSTRVRAEAQRRFPEMNIPPASAEALLLLEYATR